MIVYPEDYQSYLPTVKLAEGKMLSLGLGIGLLPEMLKEKLDNKTVSQLDIVEISKDVINLTWRYQKRPEINLIEGDAWDYIKNSNEKYDTIFTDIQCRKWDAVVGGKIMSEIARRMLKPGGIVKWWLQEITEKLRENIKPFEYTTKPCRICKVSPHMNAYNGLCLECAEEFEDMIAHYKKLGYEYKPGPLK